MRKKTFLPPPQQWLKCVELAESWAAAVTSDAEQCPPYPGSYAGEWALQWDRYKTHLQEKLRLRSNRSDLEIYTNSVWFNVFGEGKYSWTLTDPWYPGIALYTTRRFLRGDFVLLKYTNGLDRHPLWSVTGKGHRLNGCYSETNRSQDYGIISIIAPASERIGRSPEMMIPVPWSPRYAIYLNRKEPPVPDNVWALPAALKYRHPADPDVMDFMLEVRAALLPQT